MKEVTSKMKLIYNISFAFLALAIVMASIWSDDNSPLIFLAVLTGPLFVILLVCMVFLVWKFVPKSLGEKAYLILVVFPMVWLVFAILLFTLAAGATLVENADLVVVEPFWSAETPFVGALLTIGSGLVTIAVLSSLGAAIALRTVLAKRDRTPLLYVTVVLIALAISTALMFPIPQFAVILALMLALVGIVTLSPVLGTVLIGKLEYPRQQIVVGTIVLAAFILIGGWTRLGMIDDGLDAFTGQERVEAEHALRLEGCFGGFFDGAPTGPYVRRVVKDDGGEFRVLGYTWWGLPSGSPSCGAYRQWNRW